MTTVINKIVMQGFKSFNKKISVPLLSGFNCICGPNGSGKSNVLDAICFVLGRASAKSLRAERLHELIFHGGNGKKPADYAAIMLYLDNTKKAFPFEDPEISITRKVNRRGVSIYKIQGKTTTREKVLELLSMARIYPDGHNIVLQGDITNIIEMNPIERRFIIDEVSGISEYNDKRDKSKKDLEAVDTKLKEAEIIITERYDLFKRLEEERNAALRYQQLQNSLQVLKASLARRKLTNFEELAKTLDEETAKKEAENEKLQKEIEVIEKELEQRDKNMTEIVNRLITASKRVEAEREISYLRTKIMINKDKIDSNKREVERLANMIARLSMLEPRYEGEMPRAVKAVMEQKLNGVFGTVKDLINVPEKYLLAMEIAAGSHMNDVVVDNDQTAEFCIKFLKNERIGRATFLPLNKVKARKTESDVIGKKGVVGIASRLISFEKRYEEAVEFVFGNTVVVSNIEDARAIGIGKVRMVTLDGDLIERSGAMTGGYLIRSHPRLAEKMAKDEVTEYSELKKKLEQEIETFTKQTEEMEKKLKGYGEAKETKEFVDMQKLRIDSEEELDKLRQKRKAAYEKRLMVQSDINRQKVQKARIEADIESVKIEVEQYGKVEYVQQGIKSLETGIEQAVKELATIGAVNFKAIDQYDNFKTEFDEYKRKYEKILEEKKAVLEMIEKIEEKRREVFYACLKQVSQFFNEIFEKMTKGTASLELENPLDLESGLVIQANPGGKMLLNIDSMSGGEKTLTALAFLFSVQQYRPSPFYILDEIDAALDKENSKKVAELIKIMSAEAQFIVITHNDITIMTADRIYGVTIEKGESKILGLELPKA